MIARKIKSLATEEEKRNDRRKERSEYQASTIKGFMKAKVGSKEVENMRIQIPDSQFYLSKAAEKGMIDLSKQKKKKIILDDMVFPKNDPKEKDPRRIRY
jgi:hypothetical protein